MDSTAVRTLDTTVMLVGPNPGLGDKVAQAFQETNIRVIRVAHAAAACERLAVAMPQVVVVIGSLHADERDALSDRTTAVGAVLMYVDAASKGDNLDEIVRRAAAAAVERKLQRDDLELSEDRDDD